MICPHCRINYHPRVIETILNQGGGSIKWQVHLTSCPACRRDTLFLYAFHGSAWHQVGRVFPVGSSRGPAPSGVPEDIASDFNEACLTLPHSPKAAAALARRCLQNILHAHGYKNVNLSKEVDQLLNEADASKAIPRSLRETVDAIRNFGNFSVHPLTDVTNLQVIEVEPAEADWCLEILEQMFEHFYVAPAVSAARKAALNEKLAAAGKPLAK